jgi:hypothetical protein
MYSYCYRFLLKYAEYMGWAHKNTNILHRYKTHNSGHRSKQFLTSTVDCIQFVATYLKIVCYISSIFVLVFKHTTPDTTFFAPSRLHTICWNVLQGVLVHLTVPKFRQISLGVKCIHAMISIMQTQFPQKRSLLIVYTLVSKYCSKYYVEHSSTCHSDNPDVQFNLDHKSSNANLGLPALFLLLHVATIMLLLGLDLLKCSRSLYDGLLNIKVLYYDPVLLYYCTTGILSSTMGCKMYIRSARYWYAALKPCNKTTET